MIFLGYQRLLGDGSDFGYLLNMQFSPVLMVLLKLSLLERILLVIVMLRWCLVTIFFMVNTFPII